MMQASTDSGETLARRARRLGRLGIASVVLAAWTVVVAGAGNESNSPIVALAYDAKADLLLKSDGKNVYRSGDEGETWVAIPPPALADGMVAAVDTPADGAGIVYLAGRGLGVMRTEDDGAHWTALSEGLPTTQVTAFTAHASQPATLYAYLPEHGIYRSQDAGRSWRLMDRGPEGISHLIQSNMAGSMDSGWLYAATRDGVQLSMDCFCFWRDAGELGSAVQAVVFDPREPELVYAASERGLFRSADGGQAWEKATSPGSTVTALLVAPSGILYAATDDGALHRSMDQAVTWERPGD